MFFEIVASQKTKHTTEVQKTGEQSQTQMVIEWADQLIAYMLRESAQ
jgi:hypothetical protein